MKIEKKTIGRTPDGTEVELFTLTNINELEVKVMTYGATLTSVSLPDRDGNFQNVTLFLDSLEDYLAGHPFFGSIAGRFANRIAKGKFTLDGVDYTLAANSGEHHLHGGRVGFDKHVWQAEALADDTEASLELTHVSPDGDEGYPGKLMTKVTYRLTNTDELRIEYYARTDRPTHVNLTNHAYWNLAGAGSGDVLDHLLTLNAESYLPVDETLIPLGDPAPVSDTPMDFTRPQPIGSRIGQIDGGYDHCYVIDGDHQQSLRQAARVVDPKSGRTMEIHTTQPGVQLYTANFLGGDHTGAGIAYSKHFGFCLETQHFPDTPNKPQYPTTVLRPGETYNQLTVHKFGIER